MMLLDRPYPMDIWVEGCFGGRLNLDAAREALGVLALRHPLLTSRVEPFQGQLCWISTGNEIALSHHPTGAPWPAPPLRPELGEGARFYLVEQTDGCSLYMQVHHACADGTACRFLFHEFAFAYARACDPAWRGGQLPRLETERLLERGRLPEVDPSVTSPSLGRIVRDIAQFLFPWPQRLRAEASAVPAQRPFSKRILEPEQSALVLARARRQGGQLNEQAISDLFATLADWQRSGSEARPGRLRILIPIDLRQLEHRRLPACNRVTFAFLTRAIPECGPDLSHSLSLERDYIRQHRTDLDFLRSLELVDKWRLLPLFLKFPVSLSSAVLTNMGDVTPLRGFPQEDGGMRVGDVVCHHISGATSVRAGTWASFSLCRMAGRLAIGLRCANDVIGPSGEARLLDNFTDRLLGRYDSQIGERPEQR
jgi:hypothetical protein